MLDQLTKAVLTYCIPYLSKLSVVESAIPNNTATGQSPGDPLPEDLGFLCCSTHPRAGKGLPQGQGARFLSCMGLACQWRNELQEEVGNRALVGYKSQTKRESEGTGPGKGYGGTKALA